MLVRDLPANLIVTLTTIMDSYECPEYRAERYCARIAQISSKKTKSRDLYLQNIIYKRNIAILSSGAGSVTQWIRYENMQYEWGFEKKSFSALATGFENSQQRFAYFVFQLQAVGIFTPYRDFFRVSLISLCLKTFRGVARSKRILDVCQISSEKQTANSRIFRSLKLAH